MFCKEFYSEHVDFFNFSQNTAYLCIIFSTSDLSQHAGDKQH